MSTETPYQPDQLTGHEDESDGIQEYDNKAPLWLTVLFATCVVWAFGYFVHYHLIANRSQAGAYQAEQAAYVAALPAAAGSDEVVLSPEAIAAGKAVYQANCQGCHGPSLEGGVGPSLVDAEWVHGSSAEEVRKVVADGVLSKGMPGWAPMLGSAKVNEVTAFVLSAAGGQ